MWASLDRVPEPAKSAALELLADHRGPVHRQSDRRDTGLVLTADVRMALQAAGVSPLERRHAVKRAWGDADDTTVRRLAFVRGWSAKAIALFLHREEKAIRAAVRRLVREGHALAAPTRTPRETRGILMLLAARSPGAVAARAGRR